MSIEKADLKVGFFFKEKVYEGVEGSVYISQVTRLTAARGDPKGIQATARAGIRWHGDGAKTTPQCNIAKPGTKPSLLRQRRAAKTTQRCGHTKEYCRF